MIRNDGDNLVNLFVLGTDQEGCVSRKQESTGGRQLCDREVILCQRGRNLRAVIIRNNL